MIFAVIAPLLISALADRALHIQNPAPNVKQEIRNHTYYTDINVTSDLFMSVDGSLVYFGDSGGYLYAFHTANFTMKWMFLVYSKVSSDYYGWANVVQSPDGSLIFIGRGSTGNNNPPGQSDACYYAINSEDGSSVWKFTTPGCIKTVPTVIPILMDPAVSSDGKFVYLPLLDIGAADCGDNWGIRMYAIEAETGTTIWQTSPWCNVRLGYSGAAMGLNDKLVYLGTLNTTLYAIDTAQGHVKWAFSDLSSPSIYGMGTAISSPDSSSVFACSINPNWPFGDDSATLYKLDALTGTEIWRTEIPDCVTLFYQIRDPSFPPLFFHNGESLLLNGDTAMLINTSDGTNFKNLSCFGSWQRCMAGHDALCCGDGAAINITDFSMLSWNFSNAVSTGDYLLGMASSLDGSVMYVAMYLDGSVKNVAMHPYPAITGYNNFFVSFFFN